MQICGMVTKATRSFFLVQTKKKKDMEGEVLALRPCFSVPVEGTCAPDAGS